MQIRQLKTEDTEQFCSLIVDMYSHLQNLEWFTPMPYDFESVKKMIENERFYIVGLFMEDKLMAISSLDYKCGKLKDKIDFSSVFDVDNMVEIGFSIVHSSFQGKKAMQLLIDVLQIKIKIDGIKHVFGKVHKDNIASKKSFLNKNFIHFCDYTKGVNKKDFEELSNAPFFSPVAKPRAEESLLKNKDNDEIMVDYDILIKTLN